ELHAVHALVERELRERVELRVAAEIPRDAGTDPQLALPAVLGLGPGAGVAALHDVVELQHEAHVAADRVASPGIEQEPASRLEILARARRDHALRAGEPRHVAKRRGAVPVRADGEAGGGGSGLPRSEGG